jgi:hypothetical protein
MFIVEKMFKMCSTHMSNMKITDSIKIKTTHMCAHALYYMCLHREIITKMFFFALDFLELCYEAKTE